MRGDRSPCVISPLAPDRRPENGYVTKATGNPARGTRKRTTHHRYVYEQVHGKLPPGVQVHHTCENRRCINVDHLEALTISEHAKITNRGRWAGGRYQRCKALGHEPRPHPQSGRCRECNRLDAKAARRRR